jgi:4-hydroxy-tetrahydrodipicolinate synthase
MQPLSFTGTIVPLVTPFAENEVFDPPGMVRLIDFVLDQGADALMPSALTGEGPLLSAAEILAVWDIVFQRVGSHCPIIPAVISMTTQKAISLVEAAEEKGAAAVMVAPILPELYAGRSFDDVYTFYADVAARTSLPIILFNYPSLTGVDFVPALVERLVEIANVRYIKESTGDTKRVHAIQRQVGDRVEVICGAPNVALESLALGCRLWLTGIMNVVPRSAQQLVSAVHDLGDLDLARRIYYGQVLPLVDVLVRNFNPTGTIKAGVCARGVAVGGPRRPGHEVGPEDRDHLESLVCQIAQTEMEIERERLARLQA